jgi:hypothetical protein
MCRPPLTEKSAPVVKPPSSPASQATMEPISLGRAQALDRDGGNDLLQHVRLDGIDHVGADVARADGVDRHALVGQFLRQGHGEAVHAGLGGRVVGLAGLALFAVDRRDLDDAAPALFHHARHHLLGHVEHGVQVGVDDGVPVLARHLQEHAVAGDAGVVDQHVDGAMLGLGLGEGLDGGVPVGHVAHAGVEGVAQRLLLVQPLVEVAGRAAAGDDLETVLVQALADGGTDATHATGDVGNFLTHGNAPLCWPAMAVDQ